MFVERLERPNEYPTILQNTAHPIVDVLKHLTALSDRLEKKQVHLVQFKSVLQVEKKCLKNS